MLRWCIDMCTFDGIACHECLLLEQYRRSSYTKTKQVWASGFLSGPTLLLTGVRSDNLPKKTLASSWHSHDWSAKPWPTIPTPYEHRVPPLSDWYVHPEATSTPERMSGCNGLIDFMVPAAIWLMVSGQSFKRLEPMTLRCFKRF